MATTTRAKKAAVAPPPVEPEPEREPVDEVCGTCLAWKQSGRTAGECRRGWPRLGATGFRAWPETDDGDWCLMWIDRREP